MGVIKMTPEELRDGANYLGERNNAIQGEVTLLENKINYLDSNWEGAANCAFIDVYQTEVSPVLKEKMPQIIEGIMAQLRAAATTLENADNEVAGAMRS